MNTDNTVKRGRWNKGKPVQWYDESGKDGVNFRPSERLSEMVGRDSEPVS